MRYCRQRSELGRQECTFSCLPDCSRPGCKREDLQVPVSLFDLVAASLYQEKPLPELWRRAFALGLFSVDDDPWVRVVGLRLQKPCVFLGGDWCSIYPVRPLPCILFPENLVVDGFWERYRRQETFRDYHCLQQDMRLSPRRREVVWQLRQMWHREVLVSSFYLFGQSPLLIDFSGVRRELLATAYGSARDEAQPRRPLEVIPAAIVERYFQQRVSDCEPVAGAKSRLLALEQEDGQAALWGLLTDRALLEHLQHPHQEYTVALRFDGARLRPKRLPRVPREFLYR